MKSNTVKHLRQTKLRIRLRKVLFITFAWLLIALAQVIFEVLILNQHNALTSEFSFVQSITIIAVAITLSGLLGGYVIVFLLENWLRKQAFGKVLLQIFVVYTAVFLVTAAFGTYIATLTGPDVSTIRYSEYIKNYVLWLGITLGTMVTMQVSDKYGPGMLSAVLMGKYFRPRSENRIFMFLDLRSSTKIAEQLGEEKYFYLLRDCFRHITDSILYTNGEIYQYVGDEVIISWPTARGLKEGFCFRCYFDLQQKFIERQEYYISNYGMVPEFKAGLHSGKVMAGEIGIIKKEIAFSGDVLNTTARIQDKCNEMGVNILVSNSLLEKMPAQNWFEVTSIGEIDLRGKAEKLGLSTIRKLP